MRQFRDFKTMFLQDSMFRPDGCKLIHEKYPGWLDCIGDYTTQLYRDYNKRLQGSLSTNQDSMEIRRVFFRGSNNHINSKDRVGLFVA